MFINFARKLFEILVEDEFTYIKALDNRLLYETEALSLYKDKGSILYIVTIVNSETCDRQRYDSIIQQYSGLLERENRAQVILMNVLVNDREGKFAYEEDFSSGKKNYIFSYTVDLDRGEIKTEEAQPDLLNMKKKIEYTLANMDERYVNGTHLTNLYEELSENYSLPVRSKNTRLTFSLMLLIIALWLIMQLSGGSEDTWVLVAFGALSRNLVLEGGEYYRLFTAIFLHYNIAHLANNCLSLYIFGTRIEKYFGKLKFMLIFLLSGIMGNLLTIAILPGMSIGASGAIFGLLGALLAVVYKTGRTVDGLSPYIIVMLCIASIGMGFLNIAVNNYAHIAGFVSGIMLGYITFTRQEPAIKEPLNNSINQTDKEKHM